MFILVSRCWPMIHNICFQVLHRLSELVSGFATGLTIPLLHLYSAGEPALSSSKTWRRLRRWRRGRSHLPPPPPLLGRSVCFFSLQNLISSFTRQRCSRVAAGSSLPLPYRCFFLEFPASDFVACLKPIDLT